MAPYTAGKELELSYPCLSSFVYLFVYTDNMLVASFLQWSFILSADFLLPFVLWCLCILYSFVLLITGFEWLTCSVWAIEQIAGNDLFNVLVTFPVKLYFFFSGATNEAKLRFSLAATHLCGFTKTESISKKIAAEWSFMQRYSSISSTNSLCEPCRVRTLCIKTYISVCLILFGFVSFLPLPFVHFSSSTIYFVVREGSLVYCSAAFLFFISPC